MITIEIDSVDRTNDISQNSVRYSQTISKSPARFAFRMIAGEKSIPNVGDAITVQVGGADFFVGTITSKRQFVTETRAIVYQFNCLDGYYGLDRKLVVETYSNTDVETVIDDIISTYTSGFTTNIASGSPSVETVKFNYEQPSRCIQKLLNAVGWDWYITPSNVVTVFPAQTDNAPHNITDTDGKHVWGSLSYDLDLNELKNSVYVRGGEYDNAIAEGDAVDKYEANGEDNTFPLVYRYSSVQVTVNGSSQTVGTDYLDDPASYDCLYNYQEKLVRFPDGTLNNGDIVRVFGNAKVPLIIQAQDDVSIASYGERQAIEINKSISSVEEAELLATSVINNWRDGAKEGSFITYEDGFVVGQNLTVDSDILGISGQFKVNRVQATMHDHNNFVYTVEFLKSGQTTFTDILVGLIGKEKDNVSISENEVLQKLRSLNDSFSLSDEILSTSATSGPYHYGPVVSGMEGTYGYATYT